MFVVALATVALLAPSTQAFAKGGSDQRCSARGRDATANCQSIINVGDVTVTVIGDRSLNRTEINLVKAVINDNDTVVNILSNVNAVVVALADFGEKNVCVQKGLVNLCNISIL